MELLPNAGFAPAAKVAIDRVPGRKIMGQHPPTAAAAQDVENGVDDFPARVAGRTSARFDGRHERFEPCPLRITQVGGVRFSLHPPTLTPVCAFSTPSCRAPTRTVA